MSDQTEGMKALADSTQGRNLAIQPYQGRPRDAATLILIDRRGGEFFLLLGRRHSRHAFMPGRFVFPGGRTDPTDGRISVASELHPAEHAKLIGSGARASAMRAKAIALSAIRETYEEAGLLIGREAPFTTRSPHWQDFVGRGVQPSLDGLRYIARAITPPGRVRRFDTRFLAAWREEVTVALPSSPTDELEELVWLSIHDALQLEIAAITRKILGDLEQRLMEDPALSPGGPVPFYFTRGKQIMRQVL